MGVEPVERHGWSREPMVWEAQQRAGMVAQVSMPSLVESGGSAGKSLAGR